MIERLEGEVRREDFRQFPAEDVCPAPPSSTGGAKRVFALGHQAGIANLADEQPVADFQFLGCFPAVPAVSAQCRKDDVLFAASTCLLAKTLQRNAAVRRNRWHSASHRQRRTLQDRSCRRTTLIR